MSHLLWTGPLSNNLPISPIVRGDIQGFARLSTSGATGTWSPGYARCESDARNLRSTVNLTLNPTVVGGGGRSATAAAPGAFVPYYVFAIVDTVGMVALLADNNIVPTLPVGYIDYVLIDTCYMTGAATMGEEKGAAFGRLAVKQYPFGSFSVTVTDNQAALSLNTMIPIGAGGTRILRADVGLSSPVAVVGQAPYVRSTAAGTYWYRSFANTSSRQALSMPVEENNLYVDATEPGSTLQGQLILLSLTIDRGGSLV